jgi:hypothetical protein
MISEGHVRDLWEAWPMLTTSGELVMSATMLESPQDLSKEARLTVSQEVPIAEGASHSRGLLKGGVYTWGVLCLWNRLRLRCMTIRSSE